jgi:hypothetical protein
MTRETCLRGRREEGEVSFCFAGKEGDRGKED